MSKIEIESASDRLRLIIEGEGIDGRAGSILTNVLVDAVQQFVDKATDYDSADIFTADLLGAPGQFADMWRKMGKLYKCLWLGDELDGEQPDEIVRDFIGHCLLTLHYLNTAVEEKPLPEIKLPKQTCCCRNGYDAFACIPCDNGEHNRCGEKLL